MTRARVLERKAIALATSPAGWSWLFNASKWHYFDADGRSLCGRWWVLAGAPSEADQDDNGSENCATCRKRVAKLREAAAKRLAQVAANEGARDVDQQAEPTSKNKRVIDRARKAALSGGMNPTDESILRDVLIAYDQRGAVVAEALEALRDLLQVGATGSEVRLLAVGTNGQAMADPKNETGRVIHARCDEIDVARARALEVLEQLRQS